MRRMLREGEERKEEMRRKRPDPLSSYFRSQTGFLLLVGRMPPGAPEGQGMREELRRKRPLLIGLHSKLSSQIRIETIFDQKVILI